MNKEPFLFYLFIYLFVSITDCNLHHVVSNCGEQLVRSYWIDLLKNGVHPVEISHMKIRNVKQYKKLFQSYSLFFDEKNKTLGGTNIPQVEVLVHIATRSQQYAKLENRNFYRMCETGLNAGVSSLAFLCAVSWDVIMHSFDLGYYNYTHIAHKLLLQRYPHRHFVTYGNSTLTLPEKKNEKKFQCDFVFIDGGHKFYIVFNDIINFRQLAPIGATIAIDNCNAFNLLHGWGGMPGVNAAYLKAVELKLIEHREQISVGDCLGKGGIHCRETCVGVFL